MQRFGGCNFQTEGRACGTLLGQEQKCCYFPNLEDSLTVAQCKEGGGRRGGKGAWMSSSARWSPGQGVQIYLGYIKKSFEH